MHDIIPYIEDRLISKEKRTKHYADYRCLAGDYCLVGKAHLRWLTSVMMDMERGGIPYILVGTAEKLCVWRDPYGWRGQEHTAQAKLEQRRGTMPKGGRA